MRESKIEQHFRKTVLALGGKSWKFRSPNNRGVVDRIACMPDGRTWFVELKAPGKKPTKLQLMFAGEMKALRQHYACLSSIEEVDEWALYRT